MEVLMLGTVDHSRGQQKRFGSVCGGARMEELEGEIQLSGCDAEIFVSAFARLHSAGFHFHFHWNVVEVQC